MAEIQNDPRTGKKTHIADVVRHGDKLVLPEHMLYGDAIQVLQRKMVYEEEFVDLYESVDAFPWDGALALVQAIEEQFGFVFAEATPGWFGPSPPREISVEVGPGRTKRVPWGRFRMPGTDNPDNVIITSTEMKNGRMQFRINVECQRKYEPLVRELARRTREIVSTSSIYRGQAIRIRFRDEHGDTIELPEPRFLDFSTLDLSTLVFNRDLEKMLDTNITTPILHAAACRAAGVPLKRGVLLAGPYGTGKTLMAYKAARDAIKAGWTFLYLEDVRELSEAIRFAQQYSPCVIFAEDLDRAVSGSKRTVEVDQILNTIDGIDSKTSEIMVVLTTNHLDQINEAMLRPGRLDVVLHIAPPNAEAVGRLIHAYGRGLVKADEDVAEVGEVLAGQIPAVIREVVERSKLEFIRRTGGEGAIEVTQDDLLVAAQTMKQQRELLTRPEPDTRHPATLFGDAVGHQIKQGLSVLSGNGVDRHALAESLQIAAGNKAKIEANA